MNNANLNSGENTRTNLAGKSGVDSVYAITGMTGGTTDGEEIVVKIDEIRTLTGNTPTATGSMYSWNQKNGTKASTTGNMTGVYDMSGGIWEKTASYIANENVNMINYGKSMTYEGDILKTTSTKYTMVYPHNSDIDNKDIDNTLENLATASIANYNLNTKIYGDGIREVSTSGLDATTWKGEYSHFIGLYGSFMYRSGAFWDSPYTGILAFHRDGGYSNFGHGFRPVVIPM